MTRIAACCLLFAAPAVAQCVFRGSVHDGISEKPLPGTRVFAKPLAESHPPAILRVADASGGFCFEKLDRGDYEIVADRLGYLPSVHGARPGSDAGTIFSVGTETEIPALILKMIPAASLSGTVTDSSGQPVPGVDVTLLRKVWQRGWSTEMVNGVPADDRGAFTFVRLPPGTYYLRADVPRGRLNYLDENDQPFRPHEARTFYSAAFSIDRAIPITLDAGQEIPGISLAMSLATPRRISGRVTGIDWGPNEHPVMKLIADSESFQYIVEVPIRPDGSFSAENLYPTRYAASVSGTKHDFFQEIADVSAADANGVMIAPNPPSGDLRITVEAGGQPLPQQLALLNLETGGTVQSSRDSAGAYLFRTRPGRYRVKVRGNTVYVNRLVVDGRAQPDGIVEIRSGAQTVAQAVISGATARIDARIERPATAANALAVMLVWEDIADSVAEVEGDWKIVPSSGSLEVGPLAPGEYRLFAIEGFEEGPWGCPELAAALADKSVTLDLRPGDSPQVEVPVISAAEWAAALRKIR